MNIKLIASGSRPWERWTRHWGLSFLIDDSILFDTFANYCVLSKKLRRANVDLASIQAVVISHEHWDHIGGLWRLLEQRQGLEVYLPAHAQEGIKTRVRSYGGKVIDASGVKTLKTDVYVTDEIMENSNCKTVPEQVLVLKSSKGLVVIVGCSHPGILAIVQKAKQIFYMPVYGVVGGFHLMHTSLNDVRLCANKLKEEGVIMVAPTHCTGWRAKRVFKDVFRRGFVSLREGQLL